MPVLHVRLVAKVKAKLLFYYRKIYIIKKPIFFFGYGDLGHSHTADVAYLSLGAVLFQFSLSGLLFSYSQLTNWLK